MINKRGFDEMLNFMISDKEPNFKYEEITRKFVGNAMAFSYGYFSKDISGFSPIVLAEIEKNQNWLECAVEEMQATIIKSLVGNENFTDVEEIKEQLLLMTKLYMKAYGDNFNQEQENLLVTLLDRFVLGLLMSDYFIEYLNKMPIAP